MAGLLLAAHGCVLQTSPIWSNAVDAAAYDVSAAGSVAVPRAPAHDAGQTLDAVKTSVEPVATTLHDAAAVDSGANQPAQVGPSSAGAGVAAPNPMQPAAAGMMQPAAAGAMQPAAAGSSVAGSGGVPAAGSGGPIAGMMALPAAGNDAAVSADAAPPVDAAPPLDPNDPNALAACIQEYAQCTAEWPECLERAERCGWLQPGSADCGRKLWNCSNSPDPAQCLGAAAQCGDGSLPLPPLGVLPVL